MDDNPLNSLYLLPTDTNISSCTLFFVTMKSVFRQLAVNCGYGSRDLKLDSFHLYLIHASFIRAVQCSKLWYNLHFTILSVVDNFGSSFGLFSDISKRGVSIQFELLLKAVHWIPCAPNFYRSPSGKPPLSHQGLSGCVLKNTSK